MKQMRSSWMSRWIIALAAVSITAGGCEMPPKPYGFETRLHLNAQVRQVWAIAPAVNLSGQRDVDPLLQADYVYEQLQQIDGVTIVPVNRVVEVYAGMKIDGIKSPEQAAQVCHLLKCDALIVPTITAYDPYNPPKLGAALQLFQATPEGNGGAGKPAVAFFQAVGMFDAANGTVRAKCLSYAAGRNDPKSPLGPNEYLENMERYCGFVYDQLAADLLRQLDVPPPV
jgi:hypothetical protein